MSETAIATDKNNQSSNSSNKNLVFLIVIIALVIGVFFMFSGNFLYKEIKTIASSTPSTTYDNPIPFIFPANYKRSLLNYVYGTSLSQILLLLGSPGSGKSRSMVELSNEFASNSTFMLNIDFTSVGKSVSRNDLMFSIRRSIINSIAKIDGKKGFKIQSALPILKRYVKALETTMNINENSLKKSRHIYKKFQNNLLYNLTQDYIAISDVIVTSPELAFIVLLEASEAISPYIHPVIVLSCPENLFNCYNRRISHLLSSFFKTSKKFFDDYHSLPIIIEVSDQSVFLESFNSALLQNDDQNSEFNVTEKKFPFDHDRFKLLYNDGFNLKEAENILSEDNKIFTKAELSLLFETLGGHGESFAMAHELAREGFTVGEIISEERESARNLIIKAIKTSSNETRATQYLRRLTSKKEIPIPYDLQMSHYFLKNHIVTIVNETKVKFSNKRLFNAAADITSVISKAT
ncbi:hypothetical protein M9Y10_041427 [Tritrichomonas musculus]|uniref:ATPase domain-containing protein n=1 Tax=Tritrichomonas musculus TaxID=1915356 RepID=A0ABR2K4B2_9EUKA